MRHVAHSPGDSQSVYVDCVRTIQQLGVRNQYLSMLPKVVADTSMFESHASTRTIESMTCAPMPGVTNDQFHTEVYERGLKKRAPGVVHYRKICDAVKVGRCPLCGINECTVLDHHLPKGHFPSLCVSPSNLVGVCSRCNELKGEFCPSCDSGSLFHPQYDDVTKDRWLYANVDENLEKFFFYVSPPRTWSSLLCAKVARTFDSLELGVRFGEMAATDLLNYLDIFEYSFSVCGAEGVRDRIILSLATAGDLNGFTRSMLEAAAASVWFCDAGFRRFDRRVFLGA